VDLDDQLAALAAGELDDDTARALQARAATDPALAARLARFRRLETALRADAGPAAMAPAAVQRMDAAFDEALAALPDAPLLRAAAPAAGMVADGTGPGVPAGDDDRVVDLAAARARRTPRWVAGFAAAAAVLAGVVVVGPGVLGGGDDAAQDTVALDSADEDAERMDDGDDAAATMESAPADEEEAGATEEEAPAESQADTAADEQDEGGTAGPTAEDDGEDEAGDEQRLAGVPVQPYVGDDAALVRLLSSPAVADARSQVGDDGAALDARRREQQAVLAEAGDGPLARCATTALELEPAGALGLLGEGTHDGVDAIVAVLVRPDRSAVALALATDGCEVLGRAEG